MRLADIERHIASMEELARIVGAMRSIASMRVQEAMRALPGVREYGAALATGVRDALAIAAEEMRPSALPVPAARSASAAHRAIVLCTSEHGFVGGFNERLIEAAETDLAASDALLILGSRGAALAAERGRRALWTHGMATRVAGVPETVRRLASELDPLVARGGVARVEVIFARHRRGGSPIERRRLFPLDPAALSPAAPGGPPPLHDVAAGPLLESLTAEYVLAQLLEAATESVAAENAARFAAMESARDNVTRKLASLRLDASRARQEEITTELLDLVAGEQAVG